MQINPAPFDLTIARDYSRPDALVEWVVAGPDNAWFQVGRSSLANLIRVAKMRANPELLKLKDPCPGNLCAEWLMYINSAAQGTDSNTGFWENVPDFEIQPVRVQGWTPELLRTLIYVAFEKPRRMNWSRIAVPRLVTFPAWAQKVPMAANVVINPAGYIGAPAVVAEKVGGGTALVQQGSTAGELSKPVEQKSVVPKLLLVGAAAAGLYWWSSSRKKAAEKGARK
jgi:hypothetical protein